jgi:hypothetical protein
MLINIKEITIVHIIARPIKHLANVSLLSRDSPTHYINDDTFDFMRHCLGVGHESSEHTANFRFTLVCEALVGLDGECGGGGEMVQYSVDVPCIDGFEVAVW